MSGIQNNRPYSTPPTNIQGDNDYTGIDRGLFLTRDAPPKYLRVVQADWKSYGPNSSPGVLRFKLGQYSSKPTTDAEYNNFTILKAHGNDEWFDVTTSGPIHSPVLVEYWAKFIYYNYYSIKAPNEIISVLDDTNLIDDVKGIGQNFTQAVMPSMRSAVNQAMYGVTIGEPLSLIAMSATITPTVGDNKIINLKSHIADFKKFDPIVTASKLM